MYKLYFDIGFRKNIKKFDLSRRRIIFNKIKFLRDNPDHPSLRTEKLDNKNWSSSISMGIRLIWQLEGDTILIVDVGKHDIYRQY